MSRFLIFIGAVVACLLSTLIVAPRFVDWNYFRGAFEAEASRLLGREVRVGGEVNLRLLPTPYLRFEDVRIAEAGGAPGDALFKADGFTIWLAVGPLFKGALEASRVELTRPVLTLVTNASGGGNWASLVRGKPQSAFMPSNVALRVVRMTDGSVVIKDAGGGERARFDLETGEFSADALEGPYKLQANVKSAIGPRELRLSTARAEGDGSVRLKGTLRALDSGETYILDGQLLELTGSTRIEGELTATLALQDAQGAGENAPVTGGAPEAAGSDERSFNIRARVNADTAGLKLSDLSLSFESGGRPQLATGEAQVVWGSARSSTIRLGSHWLDLDHIVGRGDAGAAPLPLLARLANALDGLMPATGRTRASVSLDQATLGGDVVSGVRLEITKRDGTLVLDRLRAGLPGGTRLETHGALVRDDHGLAFEGDLMLRGATLSRFLTWAQSKQELPELRQDGSFTIRGRVDLGPQRFSIRDMMLQVAGNTVAGDVGWVGTGRRRLVVSIEGPEIDVGPWIGAELDVVALARRLLPDRSANVAAKVGSKSDPNGSQFESSVRVRTGRLVAGAISLRDLVADFSIDDDSLVVTSLKFASDEGAGADLSGTIRGLAGSSPKGSIGGQVFASRGGGVIRLAQLLGLPRHFGLSSRRAEALVPLRLAGTLSVGGRGAHAVELSADGMLAGSRLVLRALLEDLRSPWRNQSVDITASLEGAQTSALLAQVLPDALAAGSGEKATTPARVALKGVGVPRRGLVSLLTFESPGLSGQFRGRFAESVERVVDIDGETRLEADDLGRSMALLGLGGIPALEGMPARARLETTLKSHRLSLVGAGVKLGKTEIAGRLEVGLEGERPRLGGRLRVSELSLSRLLGALSREVRAAPSSPGSGLADSPSPWPDGALKLDALTDFDADVRVEAPLVRVVPEWVVTDASLRAQVADGQLTLEMRDAQALAGKASGRLTVARVPVGLSLSGDVRLADAALESLVVGDRPATTGKFGLELAFSGQSLSVRGLVTALRGKGSMTLGPGRLYRLDPAAIRSASIAALQASSEALGSELKRQLESGLASGAMDLGPGRLGLALSDGVIKFDPLVLETPDGKVSGSTTVDLEHLVFDSEWRVTSKAAAGRTAPGRGALPGVSVIYVGRLAQLGAVAPRMQSDELERELSVRRMERYVDELERVRRQDEERVQEEAERLRKLQMEPQRLDDQRQGASQRSVIIGPPAELLSPAGGVTSNSSTAVTAEEVQPTTANVPVTTFGAPTIVPAKRKRAPSVEELIRSDAQSRP